MLSQRPVRPGRTAHHPVSRRPCLNISISPDDGRPRGLRSINSPPPAQNATMNHLHRYRGIMTATCTPLDAKRQGRRCGRARHVEAQISCGITGHRAGGRHRRIHFSHRSTAPGDGRSHRGSRRRQRPRGRGRDAPGLQDTVKAAREYLRAGADSVMVVTPYYYRPTQPASSSTSGASATPSTATWCSTRFPIAPAFRSSRKPCSRSSSTRAPLR